MSESALVLGWRLDRRGHPQGWKSGRWEGRGSVPTVVSVSGRLMGSHTAVIAQSGSGKSFFLTRLVEELMTQTRACCLVLDANADFRSVAHLQPEDKWLSATYNAGEHTGWLPTETSAREFGLRWRDVPIGVHSQQALRSDADLGGLHYRQPIRVPWVEVPAELIGAEAEGVAAAEIGLCHDFVALLPDVLGAALRTTGRGGVQHLRAAEALASGRDIGELATLLNVQSEEAARSRQGTVVFERELEEELLASPEATELARYLRLVSSDTWRSYFAVARRVFSVEPDLFTLTPEVAAPLARLTVVDLPSVRENPLRLAIASAVLARLWQGARVSWQTAIDDGHEDRRVPTFVVVDEAHHLAPREPASILERRLARQLREIATEGRKLGLFLVIASQRPDRLDPIVAGECQNVAVMRLNSQCALRDTVSTFSAAADHPRALRLVRRFRAGRALLLGGWAPSGPQALYTAAPRTIVGGSNLRPGFWAAPEFP